MGEVIKLQLYVLLDLYLQELIWYAEGECQVWFSGNVNATTSQPLSNADSQAICLENISLVDGSWTLISQFSGCG